MPHKSKASIEVINRLQVVCCKWRKLMIKRGMDVNNVRRYNSLHNVWECTLCGKIERERTVITR